LLSSSPQKLKKQAWIQTPVVQDQDPDRQEKHSDVQNQDQDQSQGKIKHVTAIAWHQYIGTL